MTMSFCLTAKNLSLTGLSLIDLILRLDESDESERIRGVKDSSDNNETLRGACPERDSSVAALLQNDKGEGLRVTKEKGSRVQGFEGSRVKSSKFKVQSAKFKVQSSKVRRAKVQGSSYKLEPAR